MSGATTTAIAIAGPIVGIIAGTLIGLYTNPSPKAISAMKYLAAGVIMAAVSGEVQPEINKGTSRKARLYILGGMFMGAAAMLTLRTVFKRENTMEGKTPWALLTAIGIDFAVDSMLIGMSLNIGVGGTTAFIMSASLGLEIALITMATTAEMSDVSHKEIAIVSSVLSGIVLVFGLGGKYLGSYLSKTPKFCGLLAFAVIALIYLIAEELLRESRKGHIDVRLSAGMLFLGYGGVTISEWMEHAH